MTSSLTGRLAPSPTGAQHVGNARTYLVAWLAARSAGGRVVLRIEDIDSPRIKPWATQQALEDLRWFGLDWDEGPDVGGPHGPYLQTERRELYIAALQQLQRAERVYPCTCSRSDVLAAASAPHVGQDGPVYPAICASRCSADAMSLPPGSFCWRYRLDTLEDGYHDLVQGRIACQPACQLGDFALFKADGTPSYQLAVVVDDAAMGISQVVRGEDLIPSTFRQRAIARDLGLPAPAVGHVPLVIGEDGRRLAKRHGDTRIAVLREQKHDSRRLVGFLAQSLGLIEVAEPITPRELLAEFDWQKMARNPFVLTSRHWNWLQDDPPRISDLYQSNNPID